MIKVMNLVSQASNFKTMDCLNEGDTFIYRGKLAIMIDTDPELMYLGGLKHGNTEDFSYNESESIMVELVDLEITVKKRVPPKPKPKTTKKKR